MIYQCYFHPAQRERLFPRSPYRGFGLEPEVNPDIANKCPELAEPRHRLQLLEFAAMLHLWRNPPDDGQDWIGFTSYRQLDKCPTTFLPGEVESGLRRADVVAWFCLRFPVALAEQAEQQHPGILEFMAKLFRDLQLGTLDAYHLTRQGIYASYWAVRKTDFADFMHWFAPAIAYCLRHLDSDPYLQKHPKASSYCLERLFMAWCWQKQKRVLDLTGCPGDHPRRWCCPEETRCWQELEQRFQAEQANRSGDLHQHLDLLYRYASGCASVTEFGTGFGVSTLALLRALPERLVCYDGQRYASVEQLAQWARGVGVDFHFRQQDTRTARMEPTELLFLDTVPTFDQLRAELADKADLVGKYIIFHGTARFGEVGADRISLGGWPAIAAFLRRHPRWKLLTQDAACGGLTILARDGT